MRQFHGLCHCESPFSTETGSLMKEGETTDESILKVTDRRRFKIDEVNTTIYNATDQEKKNKIPPG